MNGKCEIHRNQTYPVFYGTQCESLKRFGWAVH